MIPRCACIHFRYSPGDLGGEFTIYDERKGAIMRSGFTKRGFILALMLVLALVAAACSSDDSGDDTTTTAASGSEDTTTTAGGTDAARRAGSN